MYRKWMPALICLIGLLCALNAIAACIGPTIRLSVAEAPAGASITVTGQYFTDGCHDVGINGRFPPTYPAKGVKILFIQSGKTQEVARVDANEKFELSVVTSVPVNAEAGAAQFLAETIYENHPLRTQPLDFKVTPKR